MEAEMKIFIPFLFITLDKTICSATKLHYLSKNYLIEESRSHNSIFKHAFRLKTPIHQTPLMEREKRTAKC